MSARKRIESAPPDVVGGYTRADLERIVMSVGTAHELGKVIRDCLNKAKTDREADLVITGMRLGLGIAEIRRADYYLAVLDEIRARGLETKAQNVADRDARMLKTYKRWEPELGDLNARRKIRDELAATGRPLTLTQINNRLDAMGAREKRKPK